MEVDSNENTIVMNGNSDCESEMMAKCAVCYRHCETTCAFCRKVYYCSAEHQREARGVHRNDCFPCIVKVDETVGRYLVATRDIQQGELIVREKPLIVGPCGIGHSKAFCTCLGCYKNVRTLYKCSKCGWPVCNAQCEMMPDHALFECKVFAECPVSPVINPSEYEKIKILRCLLLSEIMPDKWKQLLSLESHNAVRRENFGAVTSAIALYKFIKQECHLNFDFDTINHVAGVSAINSFGTGFLGTGNTEGFSRNASLLFYKASLMAHDCVPNARYVIQEKGTSFTINIVASRNIKVGEAITHVYMDSSKGTLERREHLMECYYFSCTCHRCSDPSELGTYFSGLKCGNFSCRNGYLLPMNPLDQHSDWKCTNSSDCESAISAAEVSRVIQEVKNEVQTASNVENLELILQKYKGKILHPNHYLILDMQYDIIVMIDKLLSKLDTAERIRWAKRAAELCRGCLTVADVIRPGNNRLRGTLLFHLQEVLLTIVIEKINQCGDIRAQEILRKTCKKQFAEILEITKEAREILCIEPPGSPDWQMANQLSSDSPRIRSLMEFFSFKN